LCPDVPIVDDATELQQLPAPSIEICISVALLNYWRISNNCCVLVTLAPIYAYTHVYTFLNVFLYIPK